MRSKRPAELTPAPSRTRRVVASPRIPNHWAQPRRGYDDETDGLAVSLPRPALAHRPGCRAGSQPVRPRRPNRGPAGGAPGLLGRSIHRSGQRQGRLPVQRGEAFCPRVERKALLHGISALAAGAGPPICHEARRGGGARGRPGQRVGQAADRRRRSELLLAHRALQSQGGVRRRSPRADPAARQAGP